jgi:mono/diheme cytochrome c family protein
MNITHVSGIKLHFFAMMLITIAGIFSSAFRSYQGDNRSNWVAPPSANNLTNPLKINSETVEAGKNIYNTYCFVCHGAKGKGDGVAAAGLKVRPADHTSAKVQSQTDGAIFWKMSEGRSPMPAYKSVLTETQRWQVVEYIRTLGKPRKNSKS